MSSYEIEVTKLRWFRKPIVRKFTVALDNDFGGYLYVNYKLGVEVELKAVVGSQPTHPSNQTKESRDV